MRTNQSNKLNMLKSVIALLAANTAGTAVVKAFAAALTKLINVVQMIEAKETERNDNKTGKLEARDDTEDVLIEALVPAASALAAFASANNNVELIEKAKAKKSVLHKLRDNELLLKAKAILALAQQYVDKLGDYGITAQSLTDLQQNIDNFETAMGNVEKGFSGRSGARIAVHDAFDAADNVLKNQLDKMMETVKKADHELYNKYLVARVIHDLGGRRSKEAPPTPVPAK
jgi:predicted flavoprotein YhiN